MSKPELLKKEASVKRANERAADTILHFRMGDSALAGRILLAVFLAGSLVSTWQVRAQTPAAPLEFEVASIKLIEATESAGGRVELLPGGKFTVTNLPLRTIILRAYDARDYQL